MNIDLDYIKSNNLIIYDVIYGSHAYGTNREDSDMDKRGIFILPDDILKPKETVNGFEDNEYISEITDGTQNVVYYEIRKFLYMLSNSKPNALEILNVPEECIIYKHKVMDLLLSNRNKFITKKCEYTFIDYINKQVYKAGGLNKKQNWEKSRTQRKSPIDFCYAIVNNQSKNLESYLKSLKLDINFCGITSIPHVKDVYALYYDEDSALCFSNLIDKDTREKHKIFLKQNNKSLGKGYKGIFLEDSNDIRLSSIPKGEKPLFSIYFNKDGYSMHCKDYKEYQEWLNNRNESRYTDFKSHGQGLDGKNMLHCRRVFEMGIEIANGEGINVKRENAKELLKIRRGDISLKELLDYVETNIPILSKKFKESNLPEKIDLNFINQLLLEMRAVFNSFYIQEPKTYQPSVDLI